MISPWPTRNLLVVGLVLALLGLHHGTFFSMAQTWMSNSTYNHGFAIPLIAAFFAWRQRGVARRHPADVWWLGLVCLAGLSALWTIATLINVQVIAQFASVAIVSAIVLTMAGPTQALIFALPLGYLLFSIPFGEGIVPLLMVWTADFTVAALDLAGIPVIRDGLFFSIPSGNFEVAKACSGVRYLLASTAIGFAFAFITYSGWKKRLLFILAAIIVPIFANALRALGIVLIAHYSEMRLATGIDHFIYGWFFFSIIILTMFLVGGRFADSHTENEIPFAVTDTAPSGKALHVRGLVLTGLVILALMAAGPSFVHYRAFSVDVPRLALPEAAEIGRRWTGPMGSKLDWQLDFKGAESTIAGVYQGSGAQVEVRVAAYGNQTQGAELVNSENRIALTDRWRIIDEGRLGHEPSTAIPDVRAARITAEAQSYLVWYWFQQGQDTTTSLYTAKWLEMLAIPDPSPAMIVAVGVAAPYDEAQQVLAEFFKEAAAALRACVSGVDAAPGCVVPEVSAFEP